METKTEPQLKRGMCGSSHYGCYLTHEMNKITWERVLIGEKKVLSLFKTPEHLEKETTQEKEKQLPTWKIWCHRRECFNHIQPDKRLDKIRQVSTESDNKEFTDEPSNISS